MRDDEWLVEMYEKCVLTAYRQKELTEDMREHLLNRPHSNDDELSECFTELENAVRKKDMYLLMDRIEQGEKIIAETADMVLRDRYVKGLRRLTEDLERLTSA